MFYPTDSFFNGSTAEVYVGVKSVGGANESSIGDYLGSDADINTAFWPVYYRIMPFTSKCQYYDEETDDWGTDGCEVNIPSLLSSRMGIIKEVLLGMIMITQCTQISM